MKNIFTLTIAPHRHFKKLMIVSGLVLLVVLAGEWYALYQIRARVLFRVGTTAPQTIETVHEKQLAGVLARYAYKETVRAGILAKTPLVSEPSK